LLKRRTTAIVAALSLLVLGAITTNAYEKQKIPPEQKILKLPTYALLSHRLCGKGGDLSVFVGEDDWYGETWVRGGPTKYWYGGEVRSINKGLVKVRQQGKEIDEIFIRRDLLKDLCNR